VRIALAFLLLGCTGSPDSITVYGGRGTAVYDNAATGNAAFDEVGYSYGVGLTWALPTTHSMREEARQQEIIDSLRATQRILETAAEEQRRQFEQTLKQASPTTVNVAAPEMGPPAPPTEKHGEPENSVTAQTKTILALVAAAFGLAVLGVAKRMSKVRTKAKAHP